MRASRGGTFYNRSLERALQILSAFNTERQSLGLGQLSDILKLSRPTVFRLCSTLQEYGFLIQDQESKRYSLGIRLLELGSIVLNSFSLRAIASPHLSRLQMNLGKTIFLGIHEHDELLYIDKREGPESRITFTANIGARRRPYWGMLGPVLMAYLPDEEIERLLEKSPLIPVTKKSITQKDKFIKWLHQVGDQGFAIDVETTLEGITGVGAPIRGFSGKVVAAVGAAFISTSVDSRGLKRVVKETTATALTISRELGYSEQTERPIPL
ncbi:MAG: HTH-type transcriptional regulator KipR [Syntrophorhabdus sp. PtaB.Bin006]|nr:MAG: HTH-type transcriptional regulator KipR [Syntrophorhabdus sp. PtaB.Bin006]